MSTQQILKAKADLRKARADVTKLFRRWLRLQQAADKTYTAYDVAQGIAYRAERVLADAKASLSPP